LDGKGIDGFDWMKNEIGLDDKGNGLDENWKDFVG
jgi:hypothetical protein